MKLNKIGYLFGEGVKSIFTHGFMSFASVTIIIACLVIMGSFTLLSVNISSIIKDLEAENEVVAFVDESLDEEAARAIQSSIEGIENVSGAEFVTREEAMDNFVVDYEDSLFEDIGADVFRHRYVIHLDDISLMAETKAKLVQVNGIADVNAHLDIADGFVTVRNVVSGISLVLVVILVIVSIFVMSNTIKLATFGRREEIAIMKMVGAGNGFISCPFMIEGMILGLVGAGIAFFIEWGVYTIIYNKVMTGLVGNIVSMIPFDRLMQPVLIIFLAVGFVVGAFGSNIAIRNYLKV